MWDLPRPGLEPMSPALAGRFSTTAPPGKPLNLFFKIFIGVYLVYNAVLVSAVQQSESAIRIHISPLFWISFPSRSPQCIKQSFLCYTVCHIRLFTFKLNYKKILQLNSSFTLTTFKCSHGQCDIIGQCCSMGSRTPHRRHRVLHFA